MRVKRYVVDQLPEAVALIRSELGKDAVILESRPIAVGGFMGMFRKKKIEVTAAVEESTVPKVTGSKAPEVDVNQILEQILKTSARSTADSAESVQVKPAPSVHQPAMETTIQPADRLISDKLIFEELKEMRQQMMKLSQQQASQSPLSDALLSLRRRLLDQEVDLEWIEKLTNELEDKYQSDLSKLTSSMSA